MMIDFMSFVHNKILLVDKKVVVPGSYNFSQNATQMLKT